MIQVIGGTIYSGIGKAAQVEDDGRFDTIHEATGIRCQPGTLNIDHGQEVDLARVEPAAIHNPPTIPKDLGPARIYRAELMFEDNGVHCVVFRHDHTGLKTAIEVMAGVNLRDQLGLKDGDHVTVRISSGRTAP